MSLSLELMPLPEKEPEKPAPKTVVVRYGYLKQIGEFPSDLTSKVGCGSKLVVRTERGTEICEMLTTVCGNGGCDKSITRDKMLDYIANSGGDDYPLSIQGRILRVASTQDLSEQQRLDGQRREHLDLARQLVITHNLPMKVVEVEHILGGERVIYYFTSEHRVDFRTLVRDLAHTIHTRIELRQVGARDEARITADYEKCGQHCCCKQFLKVLVPISMRSAKIQKATLDPAKISGRCGRLMCCLRYEDQTYEELRKKLPKRNTRVKTGEGEGWVVDGQILTQLVLILFDDGKRNAVPMEQILEFDLPKPRLANGQIMQGPNDRMPEPVRGDLDPAVPASEKRHGPPAGPPHRRDVPPQRGSASDGPPRPPQGGAPNGARRNAPPMPAQNREPGAAPAFKPADPIDELIADAMDDAPPRQKPAEQPPT